MGKFSLRSPFRAFVDVLQVPNPQECGGQGGCQGATVELGIAWAVQRLGPEIFMGVLGVVRSH